MSYLFIQSWHANILHTLDFYHTSVRVSPKKASLLRAGLSRGGVYYLILEAGFDVEIIKVIGVTRDGLLIIQRGQAGTLPGVWPAGTPIDSRISAKTMDELHLDPSAILSSNEEVFLAPNGDLITKPVL